MTAPHPDTETLVNIVQGWVDADPNRPGQREVKSAVTQLREAVKMLALRVAELEAALDFTREAMDEILELDEPAVEIADVATSAARAVRDRIAALDPTASEPNT